MLTDKRLTTVAVAALALVSLGSLASCAVEPTPPPTPTATTAPSPSEAPPSADCLIGDWYISQSELQGFYDAVSASSDGLRFEVNGGSGLSFAETDYVYTPEFTLLLDIAGMEGTGVTSGTIAGEYTAEGGVITTAFEESTVTLAVTVNGVTTDGSDVFGSMLSAAPINAAPYSCTSDGPLIQFSTGGEGRVPVQLVKAD